MIFSISGIQSITKLMSLSLCAKMSGESWYAFNRLGLNQLVCCTWSADRRVNHLTITRVMEKPCILSIECVKAMIMDVWAEEMSDDRRG